MNEIVGALQVIAYVLRENEALQLMNEISKHDFRIAQFLDVLILEDK